MRQPAMPHLTMANPQLAHSRVSPLHPRPTPPPSTFVHLARPPALLSPFLETSQIFFLLQTRLHLNRFPPIRRISSRLRIPLPLRLLQLHRFLQIWFLRLQFRHLRFLLPRRFLLHLQFLLHLRFLLNLWLLHPRLRPLRPLLLRSPLLRLPLPLRSPHPARDTGLPGSASAIQTKKRAGKIWRSQVECGQKHR